jgi:hypothetical protein
MEILKMIGKSGFYIDDLQYYSKGEVKEMIKNLREIQRSPDFSEELFIQHVQNAATQFKRTYKGNLAREAGCDQITSVLKIIELIDFSLKLIEFDNDKERTQEEMLLEFSKSLLENQYHLYLGQTESLKILQLILELRVNRLLKFYDKLSGERTIKYLHMMDYILPRIPSLNIYLLENLFNLFRYSEANSDSSSQIHLIYKKIHSHLVKSEKVKQKDSSDGILTQLEDMCAMMIAKITNESVLKYLRGELTDSDVYLGIKKNYRKNRPTSGDIEEEYDYWVECIRIFDRDWDLESASKKLDSHTSVAQETRFWLEKKKTECYTELPNVRIPHKEKLKLNLTVGQIGALLHFFYNSGVFIDIGKNDLKKISSGAFQPMSKEDSSDNISIDSLHHWKDKLNKELSNAVKDTLREIHQSYMNFHNEQYPSN